MVHHHLRLGKGERMLEAHLSEQVAAAAVAVEGGAGKRSLLKGRRVLMMMLEEVGTYRSLELAGVVQDARTQYA